MVLIRETSEGLYCEAGDFYVDPWRRVPRAIITHAHADHARPGSERYLTTQDGKHVLRSRMGAQAAIDSVAYGEPLTINGVRVSLHPAGHVLGSAQIRIEYRGEVWVVSGDYKVEAERTCAAFEPVRCHTFISECTFGLPVYRWPAQSAVMGQINDWWLRCAEQSRAAIVFAYSLGKAQRVLAGVDSSIGPIVCHPAVQQINEDYRASGVELPATSLAGQPSQTKQWGGTLVIAPPAAAGSTWVKKFGNASTGMASGWMLIRGTRRWRAVDRGFVLSDHADWPGLLTAIRESEAEQILLTHGQTAPMQRWLAEQGVCCGALKTQFSGEAEEIEPSADTVQQSDGVVETEVQPESPVINQQESAG